jgi:quinolinate synthase
VTELTALPMAMELPHLSAEQIASLSAEVRDLARERNAVILAHNYQVPEVQEVADFVGDSLGLSRAAAASRAEVIAFCGVHFMAESASILCPDRTVLIPDLDAGCSLADSITASQLQAWKDEHPGALVVMYVNTSAAVKALTDYCCTSSNAVDVVEHIYAEHGPDTEILFGPDMWLGAYVEKRTGRRMHVWDGECHVHAGIRPSDIEATRAAHPGAEFLIHPECGCTTNVMEYVAAGDVAGDHVHMLSTGGMLGYAEHAASGEEVIVATETGMLYPLRQAAPGVDFIAANPEATCVFMKMITLEKLRDGLRDGVHEVKVPREIADKARVPIERMVAIGGLSGGWWGRGWERWLSAGAGAAATGAARLPRRRNMRAGGPLTRLARW